MNKFKPGQKIKYISRGLKINLSDISKNESYEEIKEGIYLGRAGRGQFKQFKNSYYVIDVGKKSRFVVGISKEDLLEN